MINLSVQTLNKIFPELTYKQARACVLYRAGVSLKILAYNDDVTPASVDKLISRSAEKLHIKRSDIASLVTLRLILSGINYD